MKKILLIDNYDARFDKEIKNINQAYFKILTAVKRLNWSNNIPLELKDAALILLHKNYFEDDEMRTEDVVDAAEELQIPFIRFSGEASRGEILDSNVMYKNLTPFLDNYKDSSKIELDILKYGKNYKKQHILYARYLIAILIFNKSNNEAFVLDDSLRNNLVNLLSKMDYNKKEIEESISNLKNKKDEYKTFGDFREKLDNLIHKNIESL